MRLATIVARGRLVAAVVRDDAVLPLPANRGWESIRTIAGAGPRALREITDWVATTDVTAAARLSDVDFGPAIPDPGAIYTIGLNYRAASEPVAPAPSRPLVYGKATSSVSGHLVAVAWDRSLTANVDPECELGVVIGAGATAVSPDEAMSHVFGYTIINDISSRDPWLDGDQWLLGKSMPGFCPVGPWVVTADELVPDDLGLGCMINGVAIQDGRTSQMRTGIPELISYVSRHATLRPGDLIATGTPARLGDPLGPDRHLEAGDDVTAWIEGIGRLRTIIG
ncbi:MAG: fumarylacetoacetate hydrolase family protein [Candidatus Limnocylindria bacterium]